MNNNSSGGGENNFVQESWLIRMFVSSVHVCTTTSELTYAGTNIRVFHVSLVLVIFQLGE